MANEIFPMADEPGRYRFGWGALFAGALVFLALFLVLNAFGAAVGLSMGNQRLERGMAVWAGLVTLFALFAGGYVLGRWGERENPFHAVVHGLTLWSLIFLGVLYFTVNGIQTGLGAIMGVSNVVTAAVAQEALTPQDVENIKQRFNLDETQLAELQRQLGARVEDVFGAKETRAAAWWSFFGMLVTMLASIGGTFAGGKTPRAGRMARPPRRAEAA